MPSALAEKREGYYEDGRFAMYNYRIFEDVFDFTLDTSYSRKQVEAIEGYRKQFEGLFVDKVLKLIGIKKRMLLSSTVFPRSFGTDFMVQRDRYIHRKPKMDLSFCMQR